MKIVDKLEDTLNGGFGGLYGEVVTHDTYRIKEIDFIPEIILDLGSNVGIFSRYVRELFPGSKVVAVEPHPENYEHFKKFTNDDQIIILNKAIGKGQIWHALTAVNGSGEVYLSEGLGYPTSAMKESDIIEKSLVETIMPDKLINEYVQCGQKSLLKMDIEGAENIVFTDQASMDAMKKIDFICIELHFYANDGSLHPEVVEKTEAALKEFEETHDCIRDHIYFWARKKSPAVAPVNEDNGIGF